MCLSCGYFLKPATKGLLVTSLQQTQVVGQSCTVGDSGVEQRQTNQPSSMHTHSCINVTKHKHTMFNYNYTMTPHILCSDLP